jgi:hypothetical protein
LAPNTSASLQTALSSEAHLAEGKVLLEKHILNTGKSVMYRAGIPRPKVSKTDIIKIQHKFLLFMR